MSSAIPGKLLAKNGSCNARHSIIVNGEFSARDGMTANLPYEKIRKGIQGEVGGGGGGGGGKYML